MNLDEYFDLALQITRLNLSPEHSITAARLGSLLRQSQPTFNWSAFGFQSLKALLRAMEERGLIETGESAKGALAVWPKQAFTLEPTAPPPSARTFNPLRKSFWVAFVVDEPRGRRFFHRPSAYIRMGVTEAPSPGDEWVEIIPISEDVQKEWARAFLDSRKLNECQEFAQVLEEPEWFRSFPAQLSSADPQLARGWNRTRSARVSEAVRLWCATHQIDPAVAFQSEPAKTGMAVTESRTTERRTVSTARSQREIVLSALARLPTEYLLELPIPAKYLLQVIPQAFEGGSK